MNTTISTTIPGEIYKKIKDNGWAHNELILLGIKALEGDWENQIKVLNEGIIKLQAKLTELSQR